MPMRRPRRPSRAKSCFSRGEKKFWKSVFEMMSFQMSYEIRSVVAVRPQLSTWFFIAASTAGVKTVKPNGVL